MEFEKFGVVVDAYNTRKGYAFVTFELREEAEEAVLKLNGADLFGQQIKVWGANIHKILCRGYS